MKYAHCAGVVLITTWLSLGSANAQDDLSPSLHTPQIVVQSLYDQVLKRHPIGIPYGDDATVFTPYLSHALIERLNSSMACVADWYRRNPDPNLKPVVGLLDTGVFSGDDERAEPTAFQIDRIKVERAGRSRVDVKLTWTDPATDPWIWYVAVILVPENDHLAVDDVLYLKKRHGKVFSTLTGRLAFGCKG